jgi:hypothetical protein
MTDRPRCTATTKKGNPCKAAALPDKTACAFHDPDGAAARRDGRSRGGRTRSRRTAVLPPGSPDLPTATAADLCALLGRTINEVRKGVIDVKIANAVCYASSVLFRGLEVGDLERRLADLEQQVKGAPK